MHKLISEEIELAQDLLSKAEELENLNCTYDCYWCDCGFDYGCPKDCVILKECARLRNLADKILLNKTTEHR